MNLQDKIVVITGASGGLGKAMALVFTKEGAQVVITDINKQTLDQAASELGVTAMVLDVTNENQVYEIAKAAVVKFGRIDIWINNAGIWVPHMPMDQLTSAKVHQLMEVNFFGTMYGSQAAWRQMKQQGEGGVIINIVSISALEAHPKSVGYGASKGAAEIFTKGIAIEGQEFNIKVIGVYPAGMKTNLFTTQPPNDYDNFLEPTMVAQKIINNLKQENPSEELIIREAK